jgi:HSP20 family protein
MLLHQDPEDPNMAETEKVPVEVGQKEMEQPAASREWRVLQNVRKEIDRLFEGFNLRSWRLPFARAPGEIEPLWRSDTSWGSAVDVVDKEHGYEITAELPGMDPSNISVKFSTGTLTIKGEKKVEKEEKGKDYVLSERRWGSFQRSFRVPASIDEEKIEATFSNGVLTIVLPKSAEAQKAEKTIDIKRV